jgi:hypothetical protein
MEVAFYNETKSLLNQHIEIYHAFVFALIADKINLMCHNSTWYHILRLKDKWDDRILTELHDYFENAYEGKYGLHYSEIDRVFEDISMVKKMKRKSKLDFRMLQSGTLLKKNMKEIFADNLHDILCECRVTGLQNLIDNEIVNMFSMISCVNAEQFNLYVQEIRDMFMEIEDYLILGETIKLFYNILTVEQLPPEQLLQSTNDKGYIISVELFDFPLLCDISPDHIYYLRKQLYPEFDEFRKKMDLLRDELFTIRFEPENFKIISELYKKNLGCLLTPLQQKIEQELFIQLTRNLYKDLGFKLNLGITNVSNMIDYFPKSGIVPTELAEASKRILNREINVSRCELFFYIDLYTKTEKF